ncbi:DNA damage-regulated autophagy modulator protein 2-like [Anthonomus grandis grandis]|uniref:DNA damage-regulated autophagy modulator protein 2-like n=1 Tax=Anthonomus grandis grandis TaxID=2921223 RepID=UPI0021663C2E|nr:DNA damage-regulated autophagy modulator protein 2-like [Anthonomus grandis grandis]
MGKCIEYLPLTTVALVGITTAITFYLSYGYYQHVTYLLPYISDTGTFPPESCIFGQSLNIVSILLAFSIYIKYLQVREIYTKHHIDEKCHLNKVALIVGELATSGLMVVANFQETNAFLVHWIGAIFCFFGGSIYLCIQSLIYIKISPVIGQRKLTLVRIVLSIVSLVAFLVFQITAFLAYGQFTGNDITKWHEEDGGFKLHQISTISEWIVAFCIMTYISLFKEEFQNIVVQPLSIEFKEN